MKFLKQFVAILAGVIKFIWNAIWFVVVLAVLSVYAYSWWLHRDYEQQVAAEQAEVDAGIKEFSDKKIGDVTELQNDYRARCLNLELAIHDQEANDTQSLCEKAAERLSVQSQSTGMTLANFERLHIKLCRSNSDSDDDPQWCAEEGAAALQEAMRYGLTAALCDYEQLRVRKPYGARESLEYDWQLTKHGKRVYNNASLLFDCETGKYSEVGYAGFYDSIMTDEEQYPEYDSQLWRDSYQEDYVAAMSELKNTPFGENPDHDVELMNYYASSPQSIHLPKLIKWAEGQVNFDVQYYQQPLHVAIQYADDDAVFHLLNAGADVSRPTSSGDMPISLAAQEGKLNIVKALLEKGADPNGVVGAESAYFANPLLAAAYGGHGSVFKALTQAGALLEPIQPEQYPNWDSKVLMSAALQGGDANIVRFLKSQSILMPDKPERVWRYALEGRNPELIQYLIDLKQPLPVADEHYDLYSIIAKQHDNEAAIVADRLFKQLLSYGLNLAGESGKPSSAGHHAIVYVAPNNILEQKTAAYAEVYQSKLRFAARAVDAVLNAGVDIDHVNKKGNTMLMLAARRSHPELVKLLLARGADPKVRNAEGLTALDIAVKEGRRLTKFWKRKAHLKQRYAETISQLGGDPAELDAQAES
ncbi:hypothetical protein GCM10008090_28880 [Arenicella chitinivorans]|uniref:Ankyrin repeat domain-containing protein n=1 Tax=Arenicella chitinivorans TaxID=1329800 RepID=A0A918S1G7_9GAMM|nr:ankyrin repeat domain-containing protein [Arenicella chitinivorans]GHA17414.1 hypothetical protein GCM10008090_28880 [Arenicella chitinivorans]